ncbi:MAG TPA: helix-turn-helix domain-containing protein [Prolixibacteraceae bacterium]|nr:helix-turn-helix domain-containing protein [Prolixibacteraceae bacterium]
MNQPELGKKILELRQTKGLTQGELAEKCKLSLRTVQRIESAEVIPRSHTIKVILSSLDYDLNNLSTTSIDDHSDKDDQLKNWFSHFLKYVLELFNLKTNTMKKLSVLSLVVILITAGLLLANNDLKAQKVEGWFLAGNKPNSYSIGLDKSVYKSGGSSAFLESMDEKIEGFGTLMQTSSAEEYLGKRIKMTAFVKSDKVVDWAGMWFRVDSKESRKSLSFDNMQDRPIKGSNDWTKCEIILDVPEESGTLNYGVLLSGTGKVWFDNITFEVVDKVNAKLTNDIFEYKKPSNLDFGD